MNLQLQRLLFPSPDTSMAEVLYFRRGNDTYFDVEAKKIVFQKDARVSFDTYFNGFSIGKWRKYTQLDELKLSILLSGKFVVSTVNYELINGTIVGKVIGETIVESSEKSEVVLSFNGFHQKGMHTFVLMALEDESVFYGGGYYTDNVEAKCLQDVRIALNMCTYMREKYILKNVRKIRDTLMDNPESPLYNNLFIYITDNAMTLKEEDFQGENIHLTKQNAFGSVGGFTRGLIHILDDQQEKWLSHVIMLDDDIVLEPEVLCRTYMFLRMVKPEFRDAWLGGGMLGLDFPTLQTESGGLLENGEYKSLKLYLNLSDLYPVLYNELEEGAKINAWWFCCIPLDTIGPSDLPYPVYFHCDDMEYAYRCCKKLILLNGIVVWHEEFFYKPDTYYYDKRNREVLFSLHCPEFSTKRKARKRLIKNVIDKILWYRYHDAEEILDGIEDFLKGPDWLIHTDDRAKFEAVRKNRVPTQPIAQLPFQFDYNQYIASLTYPGESKRRRLFRRITLNGWLLPASRQVIVRAETPLTYNFYRAKRVLNYSAKSHSGYISRKEYGHALKILFRMIGLLGKITIKYNRVRDAYQASLPKLTTREFWQKRYQEG